MARTTGVNNMVDYLKFMCCCRRKKREKEKKSPNGREKILNPPSPPCGAPLAAEPGVVIRPIAATSTRMSQLAGDFGMRRQSVEAHDGGAALISPVTLRISKPIHSLT
jgi:hypothetical protein